MKEVLEFDAETKAAIAGMADDAELRALTHRWLLATCKYKYSYLFSWLGRPIIQFPQDVMAMQEIIWQTRPDLIIETGVAHGGALIFYASMMELLGSAGHVVGVDIEIRPHNRVEIEKHPLFHRITLLEGSSIAESVVRQVCDLAKGRQSILLALDSNHTHDHVLQELKLYSPLVTKGSYLVVFDTVIEEMPAEFFPDRPWGPGNNPRTAIGEFLKTNDRFQIDKDITAKLLLTAAPGGWLKCVKDS